VASLERGDLRIELFEFSFPIPKPNAPNRPVCDQGITHFCVEVLEIEQEYQRLRQLGAQFHCEPQVFPGEAVVTYGRDPDGNVFELLQFLWKSA
jgi:hypothetical protein